MDMKQNGRQGYADVQDQTGYNEELNFILSVIGNNQRF